MFKKEGKPLSIFDDDDFITIDKLKTALSFLQAAEQRIPQIKTEEPAHSTIRQELIQMSAG